MPISKKIAGIKAAAKTVAVGILTTAMAMLQSGQYAKGAILVLVSLGVFYFDSMQSEE